MKKKENVTTNTAMLLQVTPPCQIPQVWRKNTFVSGAKRSIISWPTYNSRTSPLESEVGLKKWPFLPLIRKYLSCNLHFANLIDSFQTSINSQWIEIQFINNHFQCVQLFILLLVIFIGWVPKTGMFFVLVKKD